MAEETKTESVTNTATEAKPLTTIAKIGEHEGRSVTIQGWLYNLRESGKLLFPIFRDGTGTVQGIVPKSAVPAEVFDTHQGADAGVERDCARQGPRRQTRSGGFELDVEDLEVVQRVSEDAPFPISLKEHGVDFLMEHRHLWIRTPRQAAILRTRAEIMRAAQEYLRHAWVRADRSARS